MTRGRKKTPSALNELRDNPGNRRQNTREPKTEPCLPEPPEYIQGDVRAAWKRIGSLVFGMGVLKASDAVALEVAAVAYVQWRVTAQWVIDHAQAAELQKDVNGTLRRHPLAIAHKQNTTELTRILAEFGMTPVTRTRLMTTEPPHEETEEEKLLKVYRA